jgi:hypothetical protein
MRNIEKAGFSLASILLEISPQVLPIAFEKAGKRDSFRERWGGARRRFHHRWREIMPQNSRIEII